MSNLEPKSTPGFRVTKSLSFPEYIDWNDFQIKNTNNSSVFIYVNEFKKDIDGDISKLNILKQMPNLSTINIYSSNYNVGIYLDELLRNVSCKKDFNLLDDYTNQDRSYINSVSMPNGLHLASIPNSYIQWGADSSLGRGMSLGNMQVSNIVISDKRESSDLSAPSDEAFAEIDKVIDEFCKIPNLTLIDKVVLVSNYLQRNVQFVEGKVSHVIDGNYECKDFSNEKYRGVNTVDNVLFDKIGKCNCISRTMMYMLNNPKMNVNCRIAHDSHGKIGHSYCYMYDDETNQIYCADPTWCISRNPNRFKDTLKASEFSDEYLLIGQDKLSTLDYHNTSNSLPQEFAPTSVDRKLIQQSVEKLKDYGISFDYPMEIPLPSIRT